MSELFRQAGTVFGLIFQVCSNNWPMVCSIIVALIAWKALKASLSIIGIILVAGIIFSCATNAGYLPPLDELFGTMKGIFGF